MLSFKEFGPRSSSSFQTFTPPSMHCTYVLKHKRNEWYIGYTENPQGRFAEHQTEYPCDSIYYEAYKTEFAAQERERKLKHYGSA